jgi:hypothetical protein
MFDEARYYSRFKLRRRDEEMADSVLNIISGIFKQTLHLTHHMSQMFMYCHILIHNFTFWSHLPFPLFLF